MKIIIHYFLLFVALVATTGCDKDDNYYPAPEFEGDPTAEYIEANVDFDTQISQENSDPDTFYTYFCLCNASDHKIYFTLTFCPTKNDEFIDHMNGLVDPGKKYTNRFVTSNWSMDVPGLITTFSSITRWSVYYDVMMTNMFVRSSGIERSTGSLRSVSRPGRFVIRGCGFTKSLRPAGRVDVYSDQRRL